MHVCMYACMHVCMYRTKFRHVVQAALKLDILIVQLPKSWCAGTHHH